MTKNQAKTRTGGTRTVPDYEIVQIMPCTGIRAVYDNGDGTFHISPIVALALCRILVEKKHIDTQVCGIDIAQEEGFGVCEEVSNLVGYLASGEEVPEKWKGPA